MALNFLHRNTPEQRFRQLLTQYEQPIYWHIRRLVGSHEDAQDALQETFIRAWRNLDSLRQASSERAWLYRIATNEALRLIDARPENQDSLDEGTPIAAVNDSPAPDDIQAALTAAVNTLPPRQRAVFIMRYYDDMSYDDIAAATMSNVKTVTANYHHAKERIRQYLLNL